MKSKTSIKIVTGDKWDEFAGTLLFFSLYKFNWLEIDIGYINIYIKAYAF